ncbi:MAG: DUF2231 domain-containing protein [Gemmatimonadales bacterium]
MFGYDWARTHALLTAFPVALLSVAVVFEILAVALKKDGLRRAGFALLLVGTLGAGAAVLAGLQAEEGVAHGGPAHELMEHHKQLALITLGTFAVVALWRLLRERKMGSGERLAVLLVSLGGLFSLTYTGHHGGQLVFEHAAGIPDSTLSSILDARALGHEHAQGEGHDQAAAPVPVAPAAPADSGVTDDSVAKPAPNMHPAPKKPHSHAPGTGAHDH